MSNTWRTIDFDEDHCGGQRLVSRHLGVSDYEEIVYVNEDGEGYRLFGGSDSMVEALLQLLMHKKPSRPPTDEEKNMVTRVLDHRHLALPPEEDVLRASGAELLQLTHPELLAQVQQRVIEKMEKELAQLKQKWGINS